MKKASKRKTVKAKVKKTPSRTTKKKVVKKTVKKAAPSAAKAKLRSVLDEALGTIKKIKAKGKTAQGEIDKEQKKMFSTRNPTEKLVHFFQIEGLKIGSFSKVEKEFLALGAMLNKAYAFANRIGGLVRDDFLNVCQDLSKGINLDLMERDLMKMKKDLAKHL